LPHTLSLSTPALTGTATTVTFEGSTITTTFTSENLGSGTQMSVAPAH
jgi:hypothetical protein